MGKKLFSVACVLFVAIVLSACSGNVADHKANCEEYNKNFEKSPDGSTASPVSCEKVAEKAQQTIDEGKKARIEGVCFDVAASNTQGHKPYVVKNNDGTYQYRWVNAFGSGYQDCSQAMPWAYFASLYQTHKIYIVAP
jgi:hypothetical protein